MKSDFKECADLPCGECFFVLRQMKNRLAQIFLPFYVGPYFVVSEVVVQYGETVEIRGFGVLVFQCLTVGHKKRVSALTQPLLTLNLIL